jgi:hypothetical protein
MRDSLLSDIEMCNLVDGQGLADQGYELDMMDCARSTIWSH